MATTDGYKYTSILNVRCTLKTSIDVHSKTTLYTTDVHRRRLFHSIFPISVSLYKTTPCQGRRWLDARTLVYTDVNSFPNLMLRFSPIPQEVKLILFLPFDVLKRKCWLTIENCWLVNDDQIKHDQRQHYPCIIHNYQHAALCGSCIMWQ